MPGLFLRAGGHQRLEFAGGVPVADGDLGIDGRGDDARQVTLGGARNQAREIQRARAAKKRIDLRPGAQVADSLVRGQGRAQENDIVAVIVRLAAESGRGAARDFVQLFCRAEHDARQVGRERSRKHRFDLRSQAGQVRFRGREQDVAALDISDNLAKPVGFETGLEIGHLDDVIAADVDAAQQGEVLGIHGARIYGATDCTAIER